MKLRKTSSHSPGGPAVPGVPILKRRWSTRLGAIAKLGLWGGLALCLGLNQPPAGRPNISRQPRPGEPLTDRAPWQPPDVSGENGVQFCQYLTRAAPNPTPAIDCNGTDPCCTQRGWKALGPAPDFQQWAQGEYAGRARLPHVPTYRLRVDDKLEFVFRVTRDETPEPYEMNVGDEVSVESATDANLQRTLVVLPDGTITLPLLGQVRAANLTVPELRDDLEERFKKYYKIPAITVTPVKVDTKLEDLRYTVSGRSGFGGQVLAGRVTPEGTVQLPVVQSVPAQGLTLDEFARELNQRFNEKIEGIEVVPVLSERAPRYVYVLGEVRQPGRYALEAPTTVMQALAMAGSYNVGAHINSIVIFRRADDWRLIATIVDLRGAMLGKTPCPSGEIWVSDADLIIVPKSRILWTDDTINLIFTRGLYGVVPFSAGYTFSNFSQVGAL
ncbi:MAG: polysaccharide biosynthesis/export family protein [Pirellulales bacterium]